MIFMKLFVVDYYRWVKPKNPKWWKFLVQLRYKHGLRIHHQTDAMRCDAEWRLKSLFLNSILRRVQNIIFIPHLSKNICSDVCNYPAQLLKPLMLPFTENQTNDTLFKSTFTKHNSIRGVWAVNFLLFLNYTYWAFQNSRCKVNEHRVY